MIKTTALALLSCALALLAFNAGATTIIATNNQSGVFTDGLFKLPPLNDPKEFYILTLVSQADNSERVILLPAGAIGIFLGGNAVPAGPWTWKFRAQRMERENIPLVTPDDLRISAWDLHHYDDTWLLEWNKIDRASTYRIGVSMNEETDLSKPATWGKEIRFDCNSRCLTEMRGKTAYQRIGLKAGKRYRWTVAALDNEDLIIGQSEARTFQVDAPSVVAFQKAGWKLQRSDTISARNAADPALFSYVSNRDEDTPRTSAYSAQAALLWRGGVIKQTSASPSFSLETRLTSSGDAKSNDVTRVRLGAVGAAYYSTWSANLKYETTRKDDTDKGMLELGITPVYGVLDRWLNIGSPPLRDVTGVIVPSSWPILQVKPLVSFALDVGRTFSTGSSNETDRNVKRLRSDLRLDMLWASAARALGVVYIASYGEATYWHLLGQRKNYHLAGAGVSIGITPQISLDFAYLVGEDAPNFNFTRSANVGLGIKF